MRPLTAPQGAPKPNAAQPPTKFGWRAAAALFVAYFAAAWIGRAAADFDIATSLLWPASGISLAAMHRYGTRTWRVLWAAAFFQAIPTSLQRGFDLDTSLAAAALVAMADTLGPLTAVQLIRRRTFDTAHPTFAEYLRLYLAGVVEGWVSGSLGSAALVLIGVLPRDMAMQTWVGWVGGDTMGGVALTPLLLSQRKGAPIPWKDAALPMLVSACVALAVGFDPLHLERYTPTAFLAIVPLIWLGVRSGPRAVSLGYVVVSVILVVTTARGYGPLAAREDPFLALTTFLLITSGLGYYAGTLAAIARTQLDDAVRTGERVRRLVADLPSGAVLIADGVAELNVAAQQMFGLIDRNLLNVSDLLAVVGLKPDSDVFVLPPALRTESDGRRGRRHVVRRLSLPWSDGGVRVFEMLGAAADAGDMWLIYDISERAAAEDRFRVLFEQSADAQLLLDQDALEDANPAARQLLGLDRQAQLTHHTLSDFDPSPAESTPARMREAMRLRIERAQREGVYRFEWQVHNRRNGTVPVEVTFSSVRIGTRQRTLVTLRDLTQRKRVEDELRRARDAAEAGNRAKSDFLATMSHEIRTPLNGIIGLIQILQATPLLPEQRNHLKTQQICAESLLSLLNDILDFSKLEAGRMTVERLATPPALPADEVVRMLTPRARERSLALTVQPHADVPAAVALDATLTRQILLNIVGNAVKFTEEGSVTVMVSWEASGWLHYQVRDTGIGMDESTIERVFQPFVQADSSTTRRYGGTGLGLAISRRLAELLGGRLTIRSRLGAGTTMTLSLPAEAVARPIAVVAPAADAPDRFRGRVLVAEDNPVNQTVARTLLERMGLEVVLVDDGDQAVQAVHEGGFQLVLMDCRMPVCDGFEATRRIREAGQTLPILALTASALADDRRACLDAGMNGHIAKPVRVDALREALAAWLLPDDGARPPS